MMRTFVAGATGVIGRRVVPELVASGHRVTATGRNPVRLANLERAGATTRQLNLLDRRSVEVALHDHDVVVNLATHMPSSAIRGLLPGAWRENDRLRRDASAILAEAAARVGVGRFIQESFAPVYADAGDEWVAEDAPLQTIRFNRTVLDAERSVVVFRDRSGSGIVLRFAWFYGPDARHIAEMVKGLRRGIAPFPGSPEAYLSSVSHDDAARAVVAAVKLPSGTYNVCDDQPLRRREWAAALADAFGLPHPRPTPPWITKLLGSAGELLSRSIRMSNRMLRQSGWSPVFPSAREGLRAAASVQRG